MQTLNMSVRGASGKMELKKVMVLRSWHDASGASLYLHHGTGIYGYLDGAPIKSEADLAIIGNANQYAAAKKWWDFRGKKMSEEYYAAKDAAEKARLGDFQSDTPGPESDLDYVMYESRSVGGKTKAWSAPFSWVDRFAARPDWWGQADSIRFADIEYRKADVPEPEKPETKTSPDKTGVKASEI